ncbi:VOC family protein [Nesterenkonia cremea]|uniref:Glyoxalase-like domain-containing protein n=1 Tax=Nesterenkonia cremea TaxID=1882340 RepID=A0A917AVW8_9MICC|nr:VOC family protein [Nesterenkonia cremea]GGE76455.1 hypothetical protein GCM10011401_24750 [Nesterenkonia cremea]
MSSSTTAPALQITFDAHDPRGLSCFWRDALNYRHPAPPGVDVPENSDPLEAWDGFLEKAGLPREDWNAFSALEDPAGVGPRLFFQQVPEEKVTKNRLHVDLQVAVDAAREPLFGEERFEVLEAECDRLIALGAQRLHRQEPEMPLIWGHIIMTDPEGNEFCLD